MNSKKRISRQTWRILAIALAVALFVGGLVSISAATLTTNTVYTEISDANKTAIANTHAETATPADHTVCPNCGGCTCEDTCTDCAGCVGCICHDYDALSCELCPACGECACSSAEGSNCLHYSDGTLLGRCATDHSSCKLHDTNNGCTECAYCGGCTCTGHECYSAQGVPCVECPGTCHLHGATGCAGNCADCNKCKCINCYTGNAEDGYVECVACAHTHFHSDACMVCKGTCGECFCAECAAATGSCTATPGTEYVAGYCETCWGNTVRIYAANETRSSMTVDEAAATVDPVDWPLDLDTFNAYNAVYSKIATIDDPADIETLELTPVSLTLKPGNTVIDASSGSAEIPADYFSDAASGDELELVETYSLAGGKEVTKHTFIAIASHVHGTACDEYICNDCGGCRCPDCLGSDAVCDDLCTATLCAECGHHTESCTCFDDVRSNANGTKSYLSSTRAQEIFDEDGYLDVPVDFDFMVGKDYACNYLSGVENCTISSLTAKIGTTELDTYQNGSDAGFVIPKEYMENASSGKTVTAKVSMVIDYTGDKWLEKYPDGKKLAYDYVLTFFSENEILSVVMNDGYSKTIKQNTSYSGAAHVQFGSKYTGGCTPKAYWVRDDDGIGYNGSIPVTSCKFDSATGNINIKYNTKDITDRGVTPDFDSDDWSICVEATSKNGDYGETGFEVKVITDNTTIASVDPTPYSDVTVKEGASANVKFKVTKGTKYTGDVTLKVYVGDELFYPTSSYAGDQILAKGNVTYDSKTGILTVPFSVSEDATVNSVVIRAEAYADGSSVPDASGIIWVLLVDAQDEEAFKAIGNTITFDKEKKIYKTTDKVVITVSCKYPATPEDGDIRYVPSMWQTNPIGYWYHDPEDSPKTYVAEISGLSAGEHTFTVTYRKQTYDAAGESWEDDGGMAVLGATFTVEAASGGDPKTGDDSAALIVLATLMLALSFAIVIGLMIDEAQRRAWLKRRAAVAAGNAAGEHHNDEAYYLRDRRNAFRNYLGRR